MNISVRLLLLFFLLAVLPLTLFSYLESQQKEDMLRTASLNRMSDLADKKALQVKSYLAERARDVRYLAGREMVKQVMPALSQSFAKRISHASDYQKVTRQVDLNFSSLINQGSLFYDIFLISPQGDIVYTFKREADFASNLITGAYRDSPLASAFRESLMTFESSISDFENYAPSRQPAAFIAAPVIRNGRFVGVVALQLKISKIYEVAGDQVGLGRSGETVLSRRIDPQHAMYMAPLSRQADLDLLMPREFSKVPFIMRQALSGTSGCGIDSDYRGIRSVSAWRYLPGLDWGMVVKIDADEVFEPLFLQRSFMLEVLLGLLLASGFAAFHFARQITSPLKGLVQTAGDVADGDLNMRADESAPGEIGLFGKAFNRMTVSLQRLYSTLEERIEERTRELNVSNEQLQEEIIEREHTEVALRDNQDHLRSALEDLRYQKFALDQHSIVSMTDVAGTITYVNDKFCEISGYSKDELIGQNHRMLKSGTHSNEFFRAMFNNITSGKVWNGEICNRAKNGNLFWLLTTIVPYLHDDGKPSQYIAIRADITARKNSELLLQQHKVAIETTSDGFWLTDQNGALLEANKAYATMSGYTLDELRGMHIRQFEAKESSPEEITAHVAKIFAQGWEVFETRHRTKDGREIDLEVSSSIIPESKLIVSFLRDISERKAVEKSMRIASTAFETHESIMITDANANIIRVNQAFQDTTGYSAEDVIGQTPRILRSGRHDNLFYTQMWQQLLETGTWTGEIWDKHKNGQIFPKWMTITAVKDNSGITTEYVSIFSDITARKRAEEEIYNLAFYDSLTKLPNRRFLLDRIHQARSVSARNKHYGALMFLDMDRFKTLNDTLGHDHGDLFLIEIARRLQHCVRDIDTVARIGGDEFVVLIEDMGIHPDEASQRVALIAEKIRAALSQPCQLREHEHHSSPSIGVCLFRGNDESVESLLKHADMAMYQAKESGRNAVRFFDPAMQLAVETRASLEADLRHALPKKQLLLHYQIQLDRDLRPIGAEALIRWIHPVRGMVSPAQFISIAEDSSLILDIGYWVLETACKQLAKWGKQEQTRELLLAVNVSAAQFKKHDFVDTVSTLVNIHQIRPSRLKLELTESVILNDVSDVIKKMHLLKALSVRLSLDDFGTGYSSLSYLKQLPLDQIKIDQSFVRDLATDPSDAVMVQTIINLAKTFRLNVIAEGVETEAQLNFLNRNGCMAYQGYLFSKPLPIEEFEKLLDRGSWQVSAAITYDI